MNIVTFGVFGIIPLVIVYWQIKRIMAFQQPKVAAA